MGLVQADLELARRLMVHEAEVQRTNGRELRDLGDSWLLHDPADAEPFWNRIVAPRWPDEPGAFERRLDEVITLFATIDRMPHVRPMPLGNEPGDLADRLLRNGFERQGEDLRMVLRDPGPCRSLATRTERWTAPWSRIRIARHPGTPAGPPRLWAADASLVLAEAFEVDPYRRAAHEADLLACAQRPECSIVLLFDGDEPVATARRTTAGNGTYLSSIGTRPGWRGRGHGALVTALMVCDAIGTSRELGSSFVHLAVDVRNPVARRLYERLGFEVVGEPVPDLISR
ncbi:MAG TPA: GNAT family N-acetyltransferase [Candidatus Limnocylindrales bacterium]|nr:GNAT family N-acetyltransferase [Candidatus Limnocylindrales bacterium]